MEKKKRKAIFMSEELYDVIKAAAKKNNRKMVQELQVRFQEK